MFRGHDKGLHAYMRFLLSSLLLLTCLSSFGQDRKSIVGRITESGTGDPLVGATVLIVNTVRGDLTNMNGEWRIQLNSSDKGKMSLAISFIGYQRDTIEVDLASYSGERINLKMSPLANDLKAYEVVGRFEGQQRALHKQRNAPNIKNIVAREQIELFPDVNAAEAIQRIPGISLQRDQGEGRFVQLRGTPPELTNFNINGEQIPSPEGDVRYVGLDVISADQIESIEITKALTPDMDADGIGGNVNIVTKEASDSISEIRLSLAGGFNPISHGPHQQAQFSFGQRKGKFGFHANGNYYFNDQGAHNLEYKFRKRATQEDTTFQVVYREIQLRHYDVNRERIGLSASFDYRFNNKSKIFLKSIYNRFSDDETRRRTRYKFGSGTIITPTRALEAKINSDLKDRLKLQEVTSISAGGVHELDWLKVDYLISYSLAVETLPEDNLEIEFESDELDMELDLTEANWPRVVYPDENDAAAANDLERWLFDEMEVGGGLSRDENIAYKLNLEFPYKLLGAPGFLKIGTRIRDKNKSRDLESNVYNQYFPIFLPGSRQVYLLEGPEINLGTMTDGFIEPNMFNRNYVSGLSAGPQETRDFIEFYGSNFKLEEAASKQESYAEDYRAVENIYAYYGMLSQEWGRLTLLGGVRYERTDVSYEGNELILYKGRFFEDLKPLSHSKKYEYLLPQFHIRFRANPKTNLRVAVTNTYSRPNFEDILPYKQEEGDEVKFGNPQLEFPTALNVDVLAETYLVQNGLFSGGLFYKEIKDFIFFYKRFVHLDSNFSHAGLKEVNMAQNGIRAQVYGAEVNANFKLKMLPGLLSNLGIYSNYTFTHSNAYIRERVPVDKLDEVFLYDNGNGDFVTDEQQAEERIPLPGQAAHSLNFAVFFDTKKLYLKLATNFQSEFLDELGQEPDFDVYYDQTWRTDFNADYKVTPKFRVFLQLINLTDAPLKFYMGIPNRTKQQEYYGRSGRLGLRATF